MIRLYIKKTEIERFETAKTESMMAPMGFVKESPKVESDAMRYMRKNGSCGKFSHYNALLLSKDSVEYRTENSMT